MCGEGVNGGEAPESVCSEVIGQVIQTANELRDEKNSNRCRHQPPTTNK